MMKKIELNNKMPLYLQIKENIKEEIISGALAPGQAIPPEAVLSEMYSVSRATVRQAITELVHEGYLVRQQGRGTFVNKPRLETKLVQLYSFAQDMSGRGLQSDSKIIDFEIILPKPSVKKKLNLADSDLVYKLIRLRLVEDEPIMLETTFLPCRIFPDMTEDQLYEVNSLYAFLEDNYKIKLNHVVDYFEPILIDDFVSKMLEVPKGAPALYVERIGYLNDNTQAELSQSIIRGDRCRYYVELFRIND